MNDDMNQKNSAHLGEPGWEHIKRKPNVEFRRRLGPGHYRTYGHIYWRPFIVHFLGRTIVGKRHLNG